jgi:hypothetical protein
MVEHLYGTATPTASTDPRDERAANEAAATCRPATAASSTRPLHGKEGGRRFESGRGLCKSAGNRRFLVQADLLVVERAVGMEPFMELSRRRTVHETGEHPFPRRRPCIHSARGGWRTSRSIP